jgi:hypothetical protein
VILKIDHGRLVRCPILLYKIVGLPSGRKPEYFCIDVIARYESDSLTLGYYQTKLDAQNAIIADREYDETFDNAI